MPAYHWKPIEPLSAKDLARGVSELRALYDAWRVAKRRLQELNAPALERFTTQLVRSLSVETGILERLYDIDRGITLTLVQHGFAEDWVSRSGTDIEPTLLIDILRDHEAAVQHVMDAVANNRPMTKGFVHELHVILTKHQEFTRAVDQFGHEVDTPLIKGKYKELANNPTRSDGSVHEYCPPVHVDTEMEKLLDWFAAYQDRDPILVAAWLHHRFTQIHPYQDGNGRVARTLVTLVLLRADLLPIVVDRDLRVRYLEALEVGDRGDLGPLSDMLASLERKAILNALSIDLEADVAPPRSATSTVIKSIAEKIKRKQLDTESELRKVNQVAIALRKYAKETIEESWKEIQDTVPGSPKVSVQEGGPDYGNHYYYKKQVIESGKRSGNWVNYDEDHYFVRAASRLNEVRLVFVVSFHHIGQRITGIMEITAFADLEFYDQPVDGNLQERKFIPCSLEPFVITMNSDPDLTKSALGSWLSTSSRVALTEWRNHL